MMTRLRTTVVAGLIAAGALTTSFLAAPQAQAAGTVHGCGYGAVCIYPGSWTGNNPTYQFYSYGPHNIKNQFGTHAVFNNQYNNAGANLCSSSGGKGRVLNFIPAGYEEDLNLTPVNSVDLTRFGEPGCLR